ncbi:PIR Superfamily Protein [Plasmodium ovale wallikeri]|uniref:PIR Superfamily Protein n=1 Tax=Plasmodium ovale wallikeri TaxID=864142 RepID=A0A1A9AM11_PLAOA|nr:PIR Superfamily Protein [Plasmodium ovale wallikeri]SBT57306.1 PIR Superfamily Protein [Plasmodium ovale wallikeri]
MDTSGIDELEDRLIHLPSYVMYNNFKSQNDVEYCKQYFKELLLLKANDSEIKNLCENAAGILKHVAEQLKTKSSIREYCAYFNFYIYDQIKKKFTSYLSSDIENIISEIHSGFRNINNVLLENKCSFKYTSSNIELDKWMNMKSMYDYNKNYNIIENNYLTDDEKCKINKEYLKNIKPLYEKWNLPCCNGTPECNFYYYDCDNIKDPDKLLNKIKCNDLQKAHLHDPATEAGIVLNGEGRGLHSQDEQSIGDNNASSLGPLKSSITYSIPLIGTLIICSFLYKFSPLGSWLRSKIQQKVNIKDIPYNDGTDESLEYTSQYADINSNNIPYNISYQNI